MGHSADSISEHVGVNIQADTTTIRNLVLAVLDDRRVYSVIDVCDLILKRYGSIPCNKWRVQVKKILMAESERSESCIKSTLYKDEHVFGLVENIEEWLLLRHNCRKMIGRERQIGATIGEGILAAFDPQPPRLPPGMSTEKAQIIIRGITSMGCFGLTFVNIDTLLEFPDTKKLNYARDVWNLSPYNNNLKEYVFHIFHKLVLADDMWTNAVVEAVCGLPLRSRIESGPMKKSSKKVFTIPPGLSKRMAACLVLEINFIKNAPHKSITHSILFNEGVRNIHKKRNSLLRQILSYNPSLYHIIQPLLDRNPRRYPGHYLI